MRPWGGPCTGEYESPAPAHEPTPPPGRGVAGSPLFGCTLTNVSKASERATHERRTEEAAEPLHARAAGPARRRSATGRAGRHGRARTGGRDAANAVLAAQAPSALLE